MENNIIPISCKGNVIFSEKEVININEESNNKFGLSFMHNNLTKLNFNNIMSPFYSEQFKHEFFNLNQLAIKGFKISE